ncbi:unnamed protein product [Bursaphelenchus okinawaensis]|uniref:Fatty-acid and retinol-binding protein 1 n=1 Tax=Bursaphelenchus okinawaensis TaxID=465554 RepID=A0A811KDB9_9BILA|nr:unnamed protein product [Bursaphelenchus okinawaensis]CAG9100966.1 unnamed protein product [Bursaphelenchus okinawaensis]
MASKVLLLLLSLAAAQEESRQSETLIRHLVPNYDALLQRKLDAKPEYEVLVPKTEEESDQLIASNLGLYLQLQDEVFREGGLSAALSEVIQSMIKVGFVTPTEREVDRFYTIFERLSPQELTKLRSGIPKQMEEIESTLKEIKSSETEVKRSERENAHDEQQERLMLSRMNRRV